jgi:V/A-type H+-transporting ATPase subunit E
MKKAAVQPVSAGVEKLIAQLRDEGVSKGREEAQQLADEGRAKASALVAAAERNAEEIVATARKRADELRRAVEEELREAARDLVLDLKNRLTEGFRQSLQQMVSDRLADPKFLESLILAIAGEIRDSAKLDEAEQMVLILAGERSDFVSGLTTEMLRKGVTLSTAGAAGGGLTIAIPQSGVEIALTDEALVSLLERFIQPGFRVFLKGVGK